MMTTINNRRRRLPTRKKNVWLWFIGSFLIIITIIITTMNITFLFLPYNNNNNSNNINNNSNSNNNMDHHDPNIFGTQQQQQNTFQGFFYFLTPFRMYNNLKNIISSSSSYPSFRAAWFQQEGQDEPFLFKGAHSTSSYKKIETDTKVLGLLYPPGLVGGYRNQMIRYLSFVDYD